MILVATLDHLPGKPSVSQQFRLLNQLAIACIPSGRMLSPILVSEVPSYLRRR